MKDYFKRLKTHPGLGLAAIMTFFCFTAAAKNPNIESWKGVLLLGGIASSIFWGTVLISNRKK